MKDNDLDEARHHMAQLLKELEFSIAIVEMLPINGGPATGEARARALQSLEDLKRRYLLIGEELGGIPQPVRH